MYTCACVCVNAHVALSYELWVLCSLIRIYGFGVPNQTDPFLSSSPADSPPDLARTWLMQWTGRNGRNNPKMTNQQPRRCQNLKRCPTRCRGLVGPVGYRRSYYYPVRANVQGAIGIPAKAAFGPQCLESSLSSLRWFEIQFYFFFRMFQGLQYL